ncbi:DNA cytosine methyltransferase [Luteimonas sp. XNQY3]|nr:DNA cytosine methyltransferase [Luteimonas sp. XNQY3]MCD9005166.1 DNA cytosine methyltransferase [Luteimonas sp. XNQY3]
MADGGEIIIQRAAPKVRTRIVADLFCGAGGMSNGAQRAFRELGIPMSLVGVNHWDVAIETNQRNHPDHAARIKCADLESALPLDHVPEGRLDLLMAAPSCVFHSRARGGRPVHDQQRMDPWHVVRWCTELRVARILIENVPEFVDWGPCSLVTGRPIKSRRGEYFRAWVAALQAVGFRVDWRVICCADHGDPTTRRRFFLIGRSDRGPLEWPEPSHARKGSTDLLGTRPKWRGAREIIDWQLSGKSIFNRPRPLKPNTIRRILAGAVKYRWPQPYIDALQALMDGMPPRLVFSRAEAIALGLVDECAADLGVVLATGGGGAARDLDQPLPTITTGGAGGARPGCARPQLVEPLIVTRTNSAGGRTSRQIDEPLPTICTAGGGFLADPLIVPVSNSSNKAPPRSAEDPLRTVTTAKGGDQAVAVPLVAPYYGGGSGLTTTSIAEPVPAMTTKARFALADPIVMRGNVGTGRIGDMRTVDEPLATITTSESLAFALPVTHHGDTRTHGMDEPLPTITGANRGELGLAAPCLVPNYGEREGQSPRVHTVDEPVPTITTANRFGLADIRVDNCAYEVRIDVNYRMLHWRELARATSFDDEGEVYDFAGTATEITKQIGNAVPNRTSKALVRTLMRDSR